VATTTSSAGGHIPVLWSNANSPSCGPTPVARLVGPKPGVDLAMAGFTGPNGLSGVQLTEHNTKSRAAFIEHERLFPRNGERTTKASFPVIRGVACGRRPDKGEGPGRLALPKVALHGVYHGCTAVALLVRKITTAKLRRSEQHTGFRCMYCTFLRAC
jgi:hypothetical protein